jgi:Reverse transcriptase-like
LFLNIASQHSKSEAFHFARACANLALPIDLGFAPHTGDSLLRPKDTWRYLGFFFDRKLSFKEHIRFYSTKALTTVNAMGMLGNSMRGLTPMQKHLLYWSCVVPVMTYGLQLWYFKGARVQGSIKALSQVQAHAVHWITGCFRTTPIGGMESLEGLLPMHLLLRRLSERGALRITLLADSHPLRTILGERSLGLAPAHRLGLDPGGVLSELDLLGPSRDSARAAATIQRDEYELFGPELSPGNYVRDLHPDRIFTRRLPSKSDEDVVAYQADLKRAWLEACADELCLVVTVDAAVPKVTTIQAVACALIFRGGTQVDCVISAAGRRTPPEVERFALQLGISAALSRGCQRLVVFLDSMPAVETLLDTSPQSGQIFSLDACKAIHTWFARDGD